MAGLFYSKETGPLYTKSLSLQHGDCQSVAGSSTIVSPPPNTRTYTLSQAEDSVTGTGRAADHVPPWCWRLGPVHTHLPINHHWKDRQNGSSDKDTHQEARQPVFNPQDLCYKRRLTADLHLHKVVYLCSHTQNKQIKCIKYRH